MIVWALTSICELQERTASRRASVSAYSSARAVHEIALVLFALVDDVEVEVEVGNVAAVEVLEKHALTLSAALVLGFTELVAHRPTTLGAQGFARHTALGLTGHKESDDDDAANTSIEHALGAHDSARRPLAHTSGTDKLLLVVVVVEEEEVVVVVTVGRLSIASVLIVVKLWFLIVVEDWVLFLVSPELMVDKLLIVLEEVVVDVVVDVVVLHVGVPRTRVLQSGEPLAFTHQQIPVRRLH